jgi:hypothetical protein
MSCFRHVFSKAAIALLGHKTMTMTFRYAHITQEHKKSGQPLEWIDRLYLLVELNRIELSTS